VEASFNAISFGEVADSKVIGGRNDVLIQFRHGVFRIEGACINSRTEIFGTFGGKRYRQGIIGSKR
jgi:hypothetical protein